MMAARLLAEFQSTLPMKGETRGDFDALVACGISIHSPNEGRDNIDDAMMANLKNISIHSPNEGRDMIQSAIHVIATMHFNPLSQ